MQEQRYRQAYSQAAPAHRPVAHAQRKPRVLRQRCRFRRLQRTQHFDSPLQVCASIPRKIAGPRFNVCAACCGSCVRRSFDCGS
jgi:hypothetical protein